MPRRLPPLGALRAFEAAARLGRMTAAAEELSVSPGAISRQVRHLEDHLGLPLFGGTKARPTLTAAARTLQPVLTTAFQQIEDTVRALGDARQGPLDVACFSTFTARWLIPRLFDFHAQHPGIEVRLRTTDTGTDAASEGCDLLITAEDATGARRDAGTSLHLFSERLGPVLSPALAARTGVLRTPTDLEGQPLLHTRARRGAWAAWAASAGADWHPEAAAAGPVYEHYYFTLEAAVRGLGIALAPWHLVVDDVQAGRLVAPFGFAASGYDYLALRRTTAAHPRLDTFCQWLAAQARAMPPAAGKGGH
ncbi:LysR substrate-binding domain-containing protein [Paracidovorax konjaci]|uniref:DNA-binding transcriptional regulator, LysR family n=1 Tax=Paracidovorax konjaci TaxID=32040 RepID=A0A1I1W7V5_9BURK|nr:LysR substrate-binding domain-containing protein [Paracidovorax konjaci]SFD89080.1 DNA-binding transcriptional regulator, LysR family [Paracidovorax konjaci]